MATTPAKMASVKSAKPQNAFQKPLQPSAELAAVVGSDPVSRGEVTSKVWDYIVALSLERRIVPVPLSSAVWNETFEPRYSQVCRRNENIACTFWLASAGLQGCMAASPNAANPLWSPTLLQRAEAIFSL